jgi:tetratricopeptide (TPR) repeat protein
MTDDNPRLQQLQAIAQKSKKPLPSYGLAMEFRSLGRVDDAIASFRRVHTLDATYVAAYFMRAQVHAEQGDFAAAREALTTGIEQARAIGDGHALGEMQGMLETLPE